ncbi:MAG: hypothetical protein H0V19_10195, partial [Euzebyales bacterium]|nr:hypothetical protein [Euzebyales bacterium]
AAWTYRGPAEVRAAGDGRVEVTLTPGGREAFPPLRPRRQVLGYLRDVVRDGESLHHLIDKVQAVDPDTGYRLYPAGNGTLPAGWRLRDPDGPALVQLTVLGTAPAPPRSLYNRLLAFTVEPPVPAAGGAVELRAVRVVAPQPAGQP